MVAGMSHPDDTGAKEQTSAAGQPTNGTDNRTLITAVVLMCLAFALLPVWDGLSRHSMLSALSGTSLGSGQSTPVPIAVFAYPLAALALGWSIVRKLTTSPRMAQGLFYIGAALAILYAVTTGIETATTRSHAIDSWLVCESQEYPGGGRGYVSRFKRKPAFDGPHLENGDPCTMMAENRLEHRKAHPDGDVADGLVQIWKRFPKDRSRVIGGTVFVVAAVGLATVMLRKAIGAQSRAKS